MKKRLLIVIALVCCLALFALPVCSAPHVDGRLTDNADLLTAFEESALRSKLDEISERLGLDIVIVTVDDLPSGYYSVRRYADDLYDYNAFKNDGCLLLICMEERDWYISTSGYGITAFTDAGIQYIGEQMIDAGLSDGEYASAFDRFVSLCDEFILQARSGEPYDSDNLPVDMWEDVFEPALFTALIVGAIVAFVLAGVLRSKMKTVNAKTDADSYVCRDSVDIPVRHDIYLYSHVTRTPRPKSSSSGSSTHRGSSGRSHGGGGGRF